MSDELPGVKIELSRNEALVLFEFLARFSDRDILGIEDQAEARVLWNLECILEKELPEPFQANYAELIDQARSQVRDKSEIDSTQAGGKRQETSENESEM